MRGKVTVKWSKKEKDWNSTFNNNAEMGVSRNFFDMIRKFEDFMSRDWEGKPTGFISLRKHLEERGFDPDTFTISVKAKQTH